MDRDGLLTAADEIAEDRWTDSRGAIFLPNLADDERRCTVDPADLQQAGAQVDQKLAACNDAAGANNARGWTLAVADRTTSRPPGISTTN